VTHALIVVLLLSQAAPADVPLKQATGTVQLGQPGNLAVVEPIRAGEQAREDGCYMTTASCVGLGQQKVYLQSEVKQLSDKPDWWLVALSAGVGILVGGAATYAILHKP
jgi:hypothetical protein